VRTSRSIPIAALALAIVLSIVGASCSSVNPSALTVDSWKLSDSQFQTQLDSFAKVYESANGSTKLRSADRNSWATSYTSAFLNDQLSLQLAQIAVRDRGLEVTDADRTSAKSSLEQNFTSTSTGASVFGDLPASYQQTLVDGIAAQNILGTALVTEAQSDVALRQLYESTKDQYSGEQVCASHILVLAGTGSTNTTATDAQYATALASIKDIQAQIKTPADFAAVAKAKSGDTGSAADGGALGCSPKGTFVTEFDDAAWSQPVGVVGAPVKTKYGYHLILVTARGVLTFEQLKDTLKQAVTKNASQLLTAELTRVAAKTKISVNGRYGQFDPTTGQITAPGGASAPSTTVAPSVAGTGQPVVAGSN
jgi:foldase protein PrsA